MTSGLLSAERDWFTSCFRLHLVQYVEYSFDADGRRLGTMIFGDRKFLSELESFVAPFPFAHEWSRAMRTFADAVRPVSFLFKVDWDGPQALSFSLYCRFIDNLSAEQLSAALGDSAATAWGGPKPQDIGHALGTDWPHGMGLRVLRDGRFHAAVYNRVSMPATEFRLKALPELVDVCGLPAEIGRAVGVDMASVHRPGPVGVIGVDGGADRRAAALKLDAEAVPAIWALRFVESRGASRVRVAQLGQIVRSLGLRCLGYLGLKYTAEGFDSWKIYVPMQPRLGRPAGAPHLNINQWAGAQS